MAFRYVNPGYVYLLGSKAQATQYTSNTYSNTGVAFTQTRNSTSAFLPSFNEGDDFWAKFDVYSDATSTTFYLRFPNTDGKFVYIFYSGNYFEICAPTDKYKIASGVFESVGLKLNGINSFVVHVVYGTADTAKVEIRINGGQWITSTGKAIEYSAVDSYKSARLYSNLATAYFSNVIFSNSEINPKEQVTRLPISATATNMIAGASGMYTATAAGQTLLQTPDITALAQQFSNGSKITGIQVVGNPAYKDSSGLETMIGLSKSGSITTEHGSYTVGSDSTSIIMDGWGLSGVTLADLSNMSFGWKTAE